MSFFPFFFLKEAKRLLNLAPTDFEGLLDARARQRRFKVDLPVLRKSARRVWPKRGLEKMRRGACKGRESERSRAAAHRRRSGGRRGMGTSASPGGRKTTVIV